MVGHGGPSGGQPIFTPIVHPELRRLGRKNIHIFLRERERYILRLEDAQASGSSVQPVSLKASVDPDLLLSMVEFGEFDNVTSLTELTDDNLRQWLDDKDEVSFDSLSAEALNAAVTQAVRINVHEPDPEMRVKALFMEYKTFLRIKKWDSLIEKNPKLAVSHICSLLKPVALKNKIESDLTLGKYELRKQWIPFYQYVLDQAVDCDKFVSIKSTTEHKSTSKFGKDSNTSISLPSHSAPKVNSGSVVNNNRGNAKASNSGSESQTRASRPQQEKTAPVVPLCLNTQICKERHLLKDCTLTTPEKRRKLLQEHYKNMPAKSRLNSILFDGADTVPTMHGRYNAKLADKIDVIVNGDTGADCCAISESHLQQCADQGIFVQVLPLALPVIVSLALGASHGQEEVRYEAKKKARISTTLALPVGPLRLRNVEYLVFEQHMPEILLARPVLKSMGFDLDAHLSLVRDSFHDTDFSHIGTVDTGTDISTVSLQLLNTTGQTDVSEPYQDAEDSESNENTTHPHADSTNSSPFLYGHGLDDDPFRSDDDPIAGDEDPEQTRQELKKRYEEAIENGLPEELHGELQDLLLEFGDIF